jgi:tRNA(Ile)-lysidine synthase
VTVRQVDLSAHPGLSLEEAARRARYAFLSDAGQTVGAATIAVAHNADDQVETILMHFLRGSGLSGLRGMRPRGPLPRAPWGRAVVEDDLLPPVVAGSGPLQTLIRPLLHVPRAAIEAYCHQHDLQPRVDRSNDDLSFFRNRLRHELLPQLESYNPAVRTALRRTAVVLADEHHLLRQLLAEVWPQVVLHVDATSVALQLAPWRALHVALQRSVLREAIHHLRPGLRDVGFDHVESARQLLVDPACTTGQRVTLPRGLLLTVGYTTATIGEASAPPPTAAGPQLAVSPLALQVPGVTPLPGTTWRLHIEARAPAELPVDWPANRDPWRAYLDADVVGLQPILRVRQPRDWFQPLGLGGHRSPVHAFMINHKLPAALRARWPLLQGQDSLAWLTGLRIDERARVRPQTARVLIVQLKSSQESENATTDLLGA